MRVRWVINTVNVARIGNTVRMRPNGVGLGCADADRTSARAPEATSGKCIWKTKGGGSVTTIESAELGIEIGIVRDQLGTAHRLKRPGRNPSIGRIHPGADQMRVMPQHRIGTIASDVCRLAGRSVNCRAASGFYQ